MVVTWTYDAPLYDCVIVNSVMTPLRKCKLCGKEANNESELELFPKQKKGKYGRRCECKKCFAKRVEDRRVKLGLFRTRRLVDRHWIRDLICKVCGTPLTDENWLKYVKAKHDYKCRPCYLKQRQEYHKTHKQQHLETGRKWRIKNREKERTRIRELGRKHYLNQWVNGKLVKKRCNKRPWTQICEVCGSDIGLRAYHHWDDTKLDNGMWLCRYCHIFAEKVDAGLVQKYLNLKGDIDGRDVVI
jgi:hypothetical protein